MLGQIERADRQTKYIECVLMESKETSTGKSAARRTSKKNWQEELRTQGSDGP